jgi:hypothetical protein
MSEVLLNSMIDKLDTQDRRINELAEKLEHFSRQEQVLNLVDSKVDAVKSLVEKISFPEEDMRELSGNIVTSVALLKQPMQQKIIHHHHAAKIIWVTAALFLVVCLVSSGWFITANNLNAYKANDTKYRYLKLQANQSLSSILSTTDSLYEKDGKMREAILAKEEQNERDFKMLQRAMQMEKEAKELKKQVNSKKQNNGMD